MVVETDKVEVPSREKKKKTHGSLEVGASLLIQYTVAQVGGH